MSRVRRIDVPADALAAVPGAQWSVAFQLEYSGSHTPEQWARALLENGPVVWRWMLMFGWRYVLGLHLGPMPSRWHVQGWPIAERDDNSITVEARSRILTAANVFQVGPNTVTWVTIVRYEHPIARLVWGALAPVHKLSVPLLFIRAAR